MNCLKCLDKKCKSIAKDCNGNKDEALKYYSSYPIKNIYMNSDKLVANGKAGTLSRLEEILEYTKLQNYSKVAIAYCLSIEDLAKETSDYFINNGINVISVRCTVNGITEKQIDDKLKDTVNCNPVGQAMAINNSDADFAIDMGLCLGHDVIYRQFIKKPNTTFIVKDRVYKHNPAQALPSYNQKGKYNE
jgi:uncharacterized metal-binding protein